MISLVVTTYSLIAEKQIAIDFARKELAGTGRLTAVRGIYAAILTDQKQLSAPVVTEAVATPILNTAELEQALAATLGELWLTQTGSGRRERPNFGCAGHGAELGRAHRR
jgi:hypothetical protein